jgi:hypothetical protein
MAGDATLEPSPGVEVKPMPVEISTKVDIEETTVEGDDFSCKVTRVGYTGISIGRGIVAVATVPAGIIDPIFPLSDFSDDDRGTLNAFIDMMLGKVEERLTQ